MRQLPLSLARTLLPLILNTRGKQRLSVLIFHRVLPAPDPLLPDEPTVAQFDWQMRLLREHFAPLPLIEAVERLQEGSLPPRAVCVTFDDGYADNAECALPILQKYGIPATVFVSTAFINGGRMWNDTVRESLRICEGEELDLRDLQLASYSLASSRHRLDATETIIRRIKHMEPGNRAGLVAAIEQRVSDLPRNLMLCDAQVQLLARSGVSIGAHTVNHPILAKLSDKEAHAEIRGSKLHLEDLVQRETQAFAYPNGTPEQDYRVEHRDMVQEIGFKAAVSTHWGVATPGSDSFQLPRFTPWDRQQLRFVVRLLVNYRNIDRLLANPV